MDRRDRIKKGQKVKREKVKRKKTVLPFPLSLFFSPFVFSSCLSCPSLFESLLERTSNGELYGIKDWHLLNGLKKMLASIEPVERC
jgi:hypothetical protein